MFYIGIRQGAKWVLFDYEAFKTRAEAKQFAKDYYPNSNGVAIFEKDK